MNYLTYLPILLVAIFFVVFLILKPRILSEKRSVIVAFAVGYITHAIVAALISWGFGTY